VSQGSLIPWGNPFQNNDGDVSNVAQYSGCGLNVLCPDELLPLGEKLLLLVLGQLFHVLRDSLRYCVPVDEFFLRQEGAPAMGVGHPRYPRCSLFRCSLDEN
jgi:hypothetical protein